MSHVHGAVQLRTEGWNGLWNVAGVCVWSRSCWGIKSVDLLLWFTVQITSVCATYTETHHVQHAPTCTFILKFVYFKNLQRWRDFKDTNWRRHLIPTFHLIVLQQFCVSSRATAWYVFRVSGSLWASVVFTQIWHWHPWLELSRK